MQHFKFLLAIFSLLLIKCTGQNTQLGSNELTLQEWINGQKKYDEFYAFAQKVPADCDSLLLLSENLGIKEFKDKTYHTIAKCYAHKNMVSDAQRILLKSVQNGFNPSRIDTTIQGFNWTSIKNDIYNEHHKFWKNQDSSYFSKIEKMVFKEQSLRRELMASPNPELDKELKKTDSTNISYLMGFVKDGKFPKSYAPSFFRYFRKDIKPVVIASHATDKIKLEILDVAVKEAKKSSVSWYDPIMISDALLASGISSKKVHPLWLVHFRSYGKLDLEKSYLQLYSIRRLFGNGNFKIRLFPAMANEKSNKEMDLELVEIRNALINEFQMGSENIEINVQPSADEEDLQGISKYEYTLTFSNITTNNLSH